jgi:hypothetical protein
LAVWGCAGLGIIGVLAQALLLIEGEEPMVEVRVDGPLGPFRDGVLETLRACGYSQDRAVQLVRLMAHLSRWLDGHGLGLGDLSSETVEEFFGAFRLCHNWCRSSTSLAPVLAYLRAVGAVPAADVRRAAPAA